MLSGHRPSAASAGWSFECNKPSVFVEAANGSSVGEQFAPITALKAAVYGKAPQSVTEDPFAIKINANTFTQQLQTVNQ
ncbi:hypothetical protein F2P81_001321 [Scophthalmus maximus]|uniref:Uncharacterized protein n=1 Tax=Scophthalmus maximus TaxID=52904 RepID=A0A6A4TTM1_SCOMX|nr:hypothetical protein F2P81_001321 [Scophthalmus maximus]